MPRKLKLGGSQSEQKARHYLKIACTKKAQVVEYLPSNPEILSSNPRTALPPLKKNKQKTLLKYKADSLKCTKRAD
jgi:hypothetical protein